MAGWVLKIFVIAFSAWVVLRLLKEDDAHVYPSLLSGKNVIVTGCSSGIGEEAAYYYAKLGANVVISARRESLLQKVVARCQELSPSSKFKYIVADFSKSGEGHRVVTEAVKFLGSLDVLLLNHAYLMTTTAEMERWSGSGDQHERLRYAMDVNFFSYVNTSDAALTHLRKTNGSICVVSSMIVERPMFVMPYASSKSAMSTFFSGLRQELRTKKEEISVTTIHLGLIPTEHSVDSLRSMSVATGRDQEQLTSLLPVTTPTACAEEIVRAAARRENDVFYPYNQLLWVFKIVRVVVANADEKEAEMETFFRFIVNLRRSFLG